MIKEREVMDALPRSGFVRDYVDYAMSCTDSNNSYHLAAALTAITQTTPLSYAVPFASPIHSNLYTMIVGDSSKSRKTTAMNILQNIMREALPGSIGEMPGSQEGLNEQLRSQQRQLVLYTEFGEFLSKAEQGYMMPLKTSLTSLWDCTPIGRSLANSRRGAVTDPRLSLFCGVATSLLERHTDQADWTGGFIARFLTFHAEPERAFNSMPIPNAALRASLVNQLAAMADPTVVPGVCKWLDSAGKQIWDDWMNELRPLQKSASPRAQAACSRVSSMVCKIALLLCWDSGIARMGGQFHIGLHELECALKIGNLHVKSVLELGEMVTGNKDMRDRATVLRAIGTGTMPMGLIVRRSEMLKKRAKEILETLIEERSIQPVQVGSEMCYRRTPEQHQMLQQLAETLSEGYDPVEGGPVDTSGVSKGAKIIPMLRPIPTPFEIQKERMDEDEDVYDEEGNLIIR